MSRPMQVRVLFRLRMANGGIVSIQELLAQVYGDRRDGGPLFADAYIRRAINELRQLGLTIITHHGRGYRLEAR